MISHDHSFWRAILMLAALTLSTTACTTPSEPRYPARYVAVLERGTPAANIPADAVDRFTTFFERMHEPGIESRVEAMYAPSAYFSDTLFLTEDREELVAHFRGLQQSGAVLTVVVDDAAQSDNNLYLRWRMTFDFSIAGRSRTSSTIGMTLLKFDEQGRITLHQDFWDSNEGFYRHVPVLGGALDAIGRRLADPD